MVPSCLVGGNNYRYSGSKVVDIVLSTYSNLINEFST